MRRLYLVPVALGLALALFGCSGSSHKAKAVPGLVGGGPQNASAGTSPDYKPTGDIVADNGFRSDPNGFGFQNYGNITSTVPQNMTPANVEDLFGSQVCVSGSGSSCQLALPAQKWMDLENQRMAGGHCMGFSVTALRFYSGNLDPGNFGGASDPLGLPVRDNGTLQAEIAENWTFQDLPSVTSNAVKGSPKDVLQALIQALKNKDEYYTVVFFKRDGTGGHAVTPYAVEDKSSQGDAYSGKFAILIYDNNFPGVTRAINVDVNKNTWDYVGGINPSDTNELYEGDASTQSLSLYPTSPGVGQQSWTFGSGEGGAGSSAGSVLTTQSYNQITLTGDPTNHAHLILADNKGRLSGFVNGRIVNNIPGVQVAQTISNQNWNSTPEPSYKVPPTTEVVVRIDGSDLKKPDTEELTLIGQGFYTDVSDIKLAPGELSAITFTGDGKGFVYRTGSTRNQSPILTTATEEKGVAYAISAKALGVKGGSQLTMYLDAKLGGAVLDTSGTKGAIAHTGGYGVYVMSVVRLTAHGESTWGIGKTPILLKRGWQAIVDVRHAPPAGHKLVVHTGPYKGKSPLPIQFLVPAKSS